MESYIVFKQHSAAASEKKQNQQQLEASCWLEKHHFNQPAEPYLQIT